MTAPIIAIILASLIIYLYWNEDQRQKQAAEQTPASDSFYIPSGKVMAFYKYLEYCQLEHRTFTDAELALVWKDFIDTEETAAAHGEKPRWDVLSTENVVVK